MRVIICGDRKWSDKNMIWDSMALLPHGTTIITGGAPGADSAAMVYANLHPYSLKLEVFPAAWEKYGKSAGPRRNQQMVDTNPNMILAFHDDIENSKGTKDMVERARAQLIPVNLFTHATPINIVFSVDPSPNPRHG
jgi:hypothetical protein